MVTIPVAEWLTRRSGITFPINGYSPELAKRLECRTNSSLAMRLTAPDWFYRFAYRHGIRAARLWWWFTRPHTLGAHVMIWHEGKVVLVRTSYRADWMAPGGGLKPGETPVEGAVREVSEEVGLTLRAEDLHLVEVIEHSPDYRQDKLHLFETHVATVSAIRIDNREVVEARWVTPAEAVSLNLAPPFRDYLRLEIDPE